MKRSVLRAEIAEQPDVLARLLVREGPAVGRIARSLARRDLRFVLIAARGTSDNAARYAQYALGLTCRLPVALAGPSLVTLYESPLSLRGALVVGISQSGRSPDVVETVAAARRAGTPTLAIVNDPESPLARAADDVIPLHAGPERSVAATKTYTAQLLAVALLASSLSRSRRFAEGLGALPDAVADTLGAEAAARRVAARLAAASRLVVLSRGLNYPTAHEIALKLKELALLDAEALSGADFRHGPIALAGPDLPAIVVSPPGTATEADLAELAAELRRRGSPVLLVGPAGRGMLPVPRLPELLSPIVAVVPGQLLALHAARARGLDPDNPRGLSKVTETR
jgi:glucosamine--fructose-6-phosphate aminotransferase (isomerizing)